MIIHTVYIHLLHCFQLYLGEHTNKQTSLPMDYWAIRYTALFVLIVLHEYGFVKSKETTSRASFAQHGTHASSTCREMILEKAAYCNDKSLRFVPNYLHPDIQKLEIRGNYIKNLSETSFIRYPLLDCINLSNNIIRIIEVETFKQLRHLTQLDLSNNRNLHRINDEVFRWPGQLLSLNLENTGLVNFSDKIITWLPHLQSLYLQKNKLTAIHFKSCPSTYVDLSNNQISALTPNTISINCCCKGVSLYKNPIFSVTPKSLSNWRIESLTLGGYAMALETWRQAFRGISQSEIRSLIIYPTDLTNIPQNFFDAFIKRSPSFLHVHGIRGKSVNDIHPLAFRNLTALHGLILSNTNVAKIEPCYISGMKQLRVLRISSRVKSIRVSKTGWDNTNLLTLDLSNNNINKIKRYAFAGLIHLKNLDLSRNDLYACDMASFSELKNLRFLNLSQTRIKGRMFLDIPLLEFVSFANTGVASMSMYPGKIVGSTSLKTMSLANAGFTITYDDLNRNISLFQGFDYLTTLILRGDFDVINFESNAFWGLFSLEYLDLGHMHLRLIPEGTFKDLKSLQTLKLDNNWIEYVNFEMVKNLIKLSHFNIENNYIQHLGMNVFSNNPFLASLNLARNHLVSFNSSAFEDVISTLEEIDVSGNPIVCNCNLKWLAEWLSGPIEIIHEKGIICSPHPMTLQSLQGKPLMMMLASKEVCFLQIKTYLVIALPIITMLLCVLLMYWYRWFLRHKLFLLRLAVIGNKEFENRRNCGKFEYDLNIMLPNNGCEEWIQQHFRPFLEGTFPEIGRIVFGDEDLKLGMHYIDAVLYAVENSFKTVLLVSRAAVRDHWFMLRFRLAMDYATDIGTENLILIFVEELIDDELPYLVRLFLSGGGSYLNWVTEEAGQEYFWRQFKKCLNINQEK